MFALRQSRKLVHVVVYNIKTPIPLTILGGDNVDIMTVIDAIVSIIKELGFPIAVCVAMFYYWNKERESHKEELKQVTEALNNNTLVLQSIRDRIK